MKLYIVKSFKENMDLNKIPKQYQLVNELNDEVEVYVGPDYLVKDHYQSMKSLRYLLLTTAGYNNLDIEYVKNKNIKVTNARGIYSIPIAESVVAHILYVNRGLNIYQHQQKNKEWVRHLDFIELTGAKVGFLGAGSIAEEILTRLKPFEITSSVYRSQNNQGPFDKVYTTKEGLEELFKESDYIINSLPLNNSTSGLVTKDIVNLMKKDAFYINVGRAGTNDEEAILNSLRNNNIRAAYLDVFSIEPLPSDSPVWKTANLYITPHNSPSSIKNKERINELIIKNLTNYLSKNSLINVIV